MFTLHLIDYALHFLIYFNNMLVTRQKEQPDKQVKFKFLRSERISYLKQNR